MTCKAKNSFIPKVDYDDDDDDDDDDDEDDDADASFALADIYFSTEILLSV